jgi:hypothetical protein
MVIINPAPLPGAPPSKLFRYQFLRISLQGTSSIAFSSCRGYLVPGQDLDNGSTVTKPVLSRYQLTTLGVSWNANPAPAEIDDPARS